MNINGPGRGYMARSKSGEEFLLHIAQVIELQLKEWSEDYEEVIVMKLADYELIVRNKEDYYHVQLSPEEIESLQKKSPFSLDQKVWKELEQQGLPIVRGVGNYIDAVL